MLCPQMIMAPQTPAPSKTLPLLSLSGEAVPLTLNPGKARDSLYPTEVK